MSFLSARRLAFAFAIGFAACPIVLAQPRAPQEAPSPSPKPSASAQNQQPSQGYTLPLERAAQAIAYARARHRLYFLDFSFSLLVLAVLIRLSTAPRLRDFAERFSGNGFIQAIVFLTPLLCVLGILGLPGGAASHWLARRYGQSNQGWGSWVWDWTKGQLVAFVLGTLLLWLLYAVIRRSPRRWWLYAWLGSLPILVFLIFVEPLVFEPLFFRFTPLAESHPQLATQIERVVDRAGQQIPQTRMYLMNASSKLNELNAYVTGIGASKRVVVWDTTVSRLTTPQILFVFGHEMGHYVLGHMQKGIIFATALLLGFLFASFHIVRWVVGRFGSAWRVRSVADWASLPVLLLVLLICDFISTPIGNVYSRYLEHQADQYGLEVVHGIVPDSSEVAAQSFQILGEVDLEEPSPSWPVKIWFYTHPPIQDRILFARTYDPWAKNQSPRFVK